MSYGHDEYLYQVCKNYLPQEALYIIRYHSFYAAHRENEYKHLMNEFDNEMMKYFNFFFNFSQQISIIFNLRHVRIFNPYDLYSKSHDKPDICELKPYYLQLISKFFPEKIKW